MQKLGLQTLLSQLFSFLVICYFILWLFIAK